MPASTVARPSGYTKTAGGRDPFEDLGGGYALVEISGNQFKPDGIPSGAQTGTS